MNKGEVMTINEAIIKVDRMCAANQYTRTEKIEWLNSIDAQIKQEIIDIREDADNVQFSGYTEDTDDDTELLVGVPYHELYIFYLASQIALYNGDTRKYNTYLSSYNELLLQFRNYYNRMHKDINTNLKF